MKHRQDSTFVSHAIWDWEGNEAGGLSDNICSKGHAGFGRRLSTCSFYPLMGDC